MKPTRRPHQRESITQRDRAARTYRMAVFLRVYRSALRMLDSMRPLRPGIYEISAATVLELRHRVAEAMPIAADDEGRHL